VVRENLDDKGKSMKKFFTLIFVLNLILVLAGCSKTPPASQEMPVISVPPTHSNPAFSFASVSFELDPAIANGASGEVVPEQNGAEGAAYWGINPEFTKITFSSYPVTDSNYRPIIAVYPVEAYRKLSPPSSQMIDELNQSLAQKPMDDAKLPALPLHNAVQVFHSNEKYFPFKNGNGVRFLAMYSQGIVPLNNQDLFYTYQGLTSDQKYLVSVVMPVTYPTLPEKWDTLSDADRLKMVQDPQYFKDLSNNLSAQPDGSFIPDLAKLDALVQSIQLEP
jgi:hypothetical protein